MESPKEVDSSLDIALTEIKAQPVYVGDDLHLDLWVRPKMGHPKSILIRSVNEKGEMRSSLIQVDEDVRVIPNYTTGVALTESENINQNSKKIRPQKNLFRRIAEVAFGIVVLTLVAAFLTGALQGRVVLTGSMKPSINPGDLLITKSTKLAQPKVGDVVLYSARDLQGQAVSTWAHRIISGNAKEGFTLKGDANPAPDIGKVKPLDIESIVLFKIPSIGQYMSPLVVILLGSGLALLIFVFSLWRRTEIA
jgi:signal peptidase I